MSDNLGSQLISTRLDTILRVREFADEIDKINKDSKIALLSGTSASILGGVVGIPLSIAAIVLSGGVAAVPIGIAAAVFGGLGAAGGLTSFGAGLGGHFHIKGKYEQALAGIEADRALGIRYLDCLRTARGVVAGAGGAAFIIGRSADIAEVALRAGDSVLDAGATAARVSRVAGGIGIALGIILLPVDIYILVKNSKDIHFERRHEKAEELRRMANDLEQSMPILRNFVSSSESAPE